MREVILYATKSGAAYECAELLAKQLGGCPVYDLSKPLPDLTPFDGVIIGSGVRMGKIYKPAKKFLERNTNLLLSKRVAVYFCNAYPGTLPKVIAENIPAALAKHALCVQSFGGKPPFRSPKTRDWMLKENMDAFEAAFANH